MEPCFLFLEMAYIIQILALFWIDLFKERKSKRCRFFLLDFYKNRINNNNQEEEENLYFYSVKNGKCPLEKELTFGSNKVRREIDT